MPFELAHPRPGSVVHSIANQKDRGHGIGLMTVPEAASALRLTRKAVYELIWSGALAYVRIGRRIRIPLEQLVGFVQERTIPPSSASHQPEHSQGSSRRPKTFAGAGQNVRRTAG